MADYPIGRNMLNCNIEDVVDRLEKLSIHFEVESSKLKDGTSIINYIYWEHGALSYECTAMPDGRINSYTIKKIPYFDVMRIGLR